MEHSQAGCKRVSKMDCWMALAAILGESLSRFTLQEASMPAPFRYAKQFPTLCTREAMVFELQHSNGSWSLVTLHSFAESEGLEVNGGPIFDASGDIHGTAAFGGDLNWDTYGGGCSTVWELTP
jgi:hypothetical protein